MIQHPVQRTEQQLAEIGHQPRQHHLRLGIAEAGVVLDQLRAFGGQHQPGIEEAGERAAFRRHPGHASGG